MQNICVDKGAGLCTRDPCPLQGPGTSCLLFIGVNKAKIHLADNLSVITDNCRINYQKKWYQPALSVLLYRV